MLTALKFSTRKPTLAASESRSNGPFLCPECCETVLLRKSAIRTSHFAHNPKSLCRVGALETDAHRKCKQAIYEALLKEPSVKNVALERSLKTCRPDISARINGVPVAIEVQISSLSLEAIIRRTEEYAHKGIYVLWLLQWTPYIDGIRYAPRLWEKWIHAAYFGRVYYWKKGLEVSSYRFDAFESLRQPRSRKYRTPIRVGTLNIVHDFQPRIRPARDGPGFRIPRARLFSPKPTIEGSIELS